MNICFCEIRGRWPDSFQLRANMMEELDRRGIVSSEMKVQHGTFERVWSKA